jgi:hypothetical protein
LSLRSTANIIRLARSGRLVYLQHIEYQPRAISLNLIVPQIKWIEKSVTTYPRTFNTGDNKQEGKEWT